MNDVVCTVCGQPIPEDEWWAAVVWPTRDGSAAAHIICFYAVEEAIRP